MVTSSDKISVLLSGVFLINRSMKFDLALDTTTLLNPSLLTSALDHADLPHLAMNLLTMQLVGKRLELRLGSTGFLLFSVIALVTSTLLESVIYRGVLAKFHEDVSLGYSAVLFSYTTTIAFLEPATLWNINPIIGGPRLVVEGRWVPWAQLLMSSILIENSSFVGHLSGILGGFVANHAMGIFHAFQKKRGGRRLGRS